MAGKFSYAADAREAVEQLIALRATNRDAFSEALSSVPGAARIADAARTIAFSAIADGDLARAEASIMIEAAACAELNDQRAMLESGIRLAEIKKVLAEEISEYEIARHLARAWAGFARKMKSTSAEFDARAVVADSAYFAAEKCYAERDLVAFHNWLLMTLNDCAEAFEISPASSNPGMRKNFLNLLYATADRVMHQHWFDVCDPDDSDNDREDRTNVNARLRQIALGFETYIGSDLSADTTASAAAEDWLILARVSYSHGSPDKAFERLTRLIERAQSEGDISAYINASGARYLGERTSSRSPERLRDLRVEYQSAIADFRGAMRSRAGRMQVGEILDRTIGAMVTDELAERVSPDPLAAFDVMEVAKARCLLDDVNGLWHPIDDDEAGHRALAYEKELVHIPVSSTADSTGSEEFRLLSRLPFGGLHGHHEDVEALRLLERIYGPADAGYRGSAPIVALEQVQSMLAPDEAILSYHIPYESLDPGGTILMMWITAQHAFTLDLPLIYEGELEIIGRIQADGSQPLDVGPLMNNVAMTRLAIRQGQDDLVGGDLKELYRILIDPMETYGFDAAALSRLIIAPSGVLHAVPFAALQNSQGTTLIEKTPLVVVPSVSVWTSLAAKQALMPTPASYIGFGNPSVPDDDWETLEEAEREVHSAADKLSGCTVTVYTGRDASEASFVRDTPGKALLHIASHGEFPEEDVVDMHRIVLSADADRDGLLHAEEIRQCDLSSAQLAVLSVCDGALFRFGPGDEPLGLLPAFFAAGTTNVIAPLWEIDDRAASDWMSEFYDGLLRLGPARALQKACVTQLQKGVQIRDWAGFALFGAGSDFAQKRTPEV
jgi:CHAT domain-containing protein